MTTDTIKFKARSACMMLIAIVIVSCTALAQTQDEDRTLSPYFFVKGDPSIDHLPLKDTRVEIAVSGVIADVRWCKPIEMKVQGQSMQPMSFRPPHVPRSTGCECG